ncbi:hydroxyacid dehydrogenase [Acuticoccus sp. M5D2P5]|uniref:NAD(P)-dependent oxidoreductase n=1 Tax=Acuticoccus kalidii TaxID=2910977 RepID=UPI001F212225|nr:NAD(P)-dependent oxidoreductase [Acuticoccus kalidii]MCF3932358.1 hydroxyacid dehydrogenase [Acuticoccus kalidii]
MRILLTHTRHMLANYYGAGPLAALRALADVRINDSDAVLEGAALAEAAKGCDIVLSDRQTPGPTPFFAAAPDVVAFMRCAVDVRNIDVDEASRHGVLVTQATPGFTASVVELGVGFMVDLARGMTDYASDYRSGGEPDGQMGRQLAGATVGVIGYGTLGKRFSEVARAIGMRVLVSDPHKTITDEGITQVDLPTLLSEADFVVCLAIATEETENLIDAAAFARMRPTSYFINLSRGNLVDEAALTAVLDAKGIAGAAIDVGRAPDQKPSLDLARRSDVIAAPHVGGLTPEAISHQAYDTVAQVKALTEGHMPKGAVNPDAAERLARIGVAR